MGGSPALPLEHAGEGHEGRGRDFSVSRKTKQEGAEKGPPSRLWLLFLLLSQCSIEFRDSGNFCLSYHLVLICAKNWDI